MNNYKNSLVETIETLNAEGVEYIFIDPKSPIRQVDFFLTQDLSYESLKNDVEKMDLDGQMINVLTKQKLVELKLKVNPMRDKDLSDIRELQRLILDEEKN